MLKSYLPFSQERSSTAIITDDCSGHRTDDIPENSDPHTIPGGCTKAIQIHDRVFNRLFKRQYNELLSEWRLHNNKEKVSRYLVLEWIEAHTLVWKTHREAILKAARTYIKRPATENPWVEHPNTQPQSQLHSPEDHGALLNSHEDTCESKSTCETKKPEHMCARFSELYCRPGHRVAKVSATEMLSSNTCCRSNMRKCHEDVSHVTRCRQKHTVS